MASDAKYMIKMSDLMASLEKDHPNIRRTMALAKEMIDEDERAMNTEGLVAVPIAEYNKLREQASGNVMAERERCVKILQGLRMSAPLNEQASALLSNAIELIIEKDDDVAP